MSHPTYKPSPWFATKAFVCAVITAFSFTGCWGKGVCVLNCTSASSPSAPGDTGVDDETRSIGPTVLSVSSTTSNGTYVAGQTISIQVEFSDPVFVDGIPRITLETGSTDAIAYYVSGSGTTTLTFEYVVGSGETSNDLDYVSATAMTMNGATITDAQGTTPTFTFPDTGAAGSLSANKTIAIDALGPTVSNVTSSTTNSSYSVGNSISIQVTFSESVTVAGTPRLTLETGATDAVVNYVSGSGSATLTFTYTIATGEVSNDLDYVSTSAMDLNGGTIRDGAGNDATLTLPALAGVGSLSANKALVVDALGPTITNVTSSTANGTYGVSGSASIQVTFSEAVTVTGGPQLTLETGTSDAVVAYATGSGTATLNFTYTITSGESSSDLDYTSTSALALNGGTIRDAIGNNATLTLPSPGATGSLGANKAIVIDGVAPAITGVSSSTSNGTYKVGDAISIQVTFDEVVTVSAFPTLTLETGGVDGVATYSSGSASNTLTFTYTVASGESSSDLDYLSTLAIGVSTSSILDASGNNANITLPSPGAAGSLGANKAIVIDGNLPTITNVTCPTANGTYTIGAPLGIQVTFSEAVFVTGTPRITLETGSTDAVVNYTSGSASNVLTFTYVIASGEASNDLDYASTSALALNSGTIRDAAGNDATLTLFSPGAAGSLGANKALVVDGTIPTVTNVTSSTANGSYSVGQSISIQVVFSETVTVTGTPRLTLETGATDAVVDYASGSTTNTLVFTYTIAGSEASSDLDYASTSALALNSGTIRDAAGNNATLTLVSPGAAGSLGANKALVVGGSGGAITVTDVTSSTANGLYSQGQTISIQITFSATAFVTGTPQLELETGTTDAVADYSSGSGSDTLTFTYTVANSNASSDLDYRGTGSLTLNGGTIHNEGVAANRTLPAPGAAGSLGANKAIVVIEPAVTPYLIEGGETAAYLGWDVANAGDTDGDGYSDFIVGEPYANGAGTDRGKAYVYSGKTGLVLHTITGLSDGALLGFSVSGAGDVDGDGRHDFIVGEPRHPSGGSQRGRALVYSGATGSVIHTFAGTEDGAELGVAVDSAGDVNGDGKSDLIVGEHRADTGGSDRGKGYVYSGASGSVLYELNGQNSNAYFGNAVAGIGDVNRDGRSDFVIAEYRYSGLGIDRGKIHVYDGRTGTQIQEIDGDENEGYFGYSVAGAGDVNGDGRADIVVSQHTANLGGTDRGNALVYNGYNGVLIHTFSGTADNEHFGFSVGGAGDVDGDGRADIVVGARGADSGQGTVHVYSGRTGSEIVSASGEGIGANFGYAVAGLGDVTDDGRSDFIVGEALYGASDVGRVHVFSARYASTPTGNPAQEWGLDGSGENTVFGYSVSQVGDLSGDGRPDLLMGEPGADGGRGRVYAYNGATMVLLMQMDGTEIGGGLGNSVAGIGDVNDDGTPDILAGEPNADGVGGGVDRGKAYVLSGADGTILYHYEGVAPMANLGKSVAAAGDVNRDGRPDFIIGEPGSPSGGTNRGRVYVYSGRDGTLLGEILGSENSAFLGSSVAGIGDVDGDGRADFIISEELAADGAGRAYVFKGSDFELLYTYSGLEDGSRLGHAVAGAGDVNRDGFSDFLISEYNASEGGTSRGKVYVFSGADGAALRTLSGTTDNEFFGNSLSGLGDFDGDGRPDFAIGRAYAGSQTGAVSIYSGRSSSQLHEIVGEEIGALFGWAVSGVGDTNDDGKADIFVGIPYSDDGQTDRGQAIHFVAPSD